MDRRLALDEALVAVSARFIHAGDMDGAICHCLGDIGHLTRAAHVILFVANDPGTVLENVPALKDWSDYDLTGLSVAGEMSGSIVDDPDGRPRLLMLLTTDPAEPGLA